MTSKAETKLYQALSSALAHAAAGHGLEGFAINIPFEEISPGDDSGVLLKVSIEFEWTSFEDVYFEDIAEELEE